MQVRIGVTYTAREIEVELAEDTDRDRLKATIDEALSDDDNVLWLSDKSGREVAVPAAKIAWLELGRPDSERRIGFGAS